MRQANNFFNVILRPEDNTFYIRETSAKLGTGGGSALLNLNNIDLVINGNLRYKAEIQDDPFAKMSESKLYELFQEKAKVMVKGYNTKYAKLNRIQKFFFKNQIPQKYSNPETLLYPFHLYQFFNLPEHPKGLFTPPLESAKSTLKNIKEFLNTFNNLLNNNPYYLNISRVKTT